MNYPTEHVHYQLKVSAYPKRNESRLFRSPSLIHCDKDRFRNGKKLEFHADTCFNSGQVLREPKQTILTNGNFT